jgi:undecaprenyl diphosphate synthase
MGASEAGPQHVAIIMDGNGRWATRRGLPRLAGHRAGTRNLRRVVEAFLEHEVPYLTVYAFSTENWLRPFEEVTGLFGILEDVIEEEARVLHDAGIQIRHIGREDGISPSLLEQIKWAIHLTRNNDRMVLNFAFNYGGRAELVDAVRRIVVDGLEPGEINDAVLRSYLYTPDTPDPDLIIRTGGEMRLSNFLIFQAAYAEYYSTPVCWPDFGPEDVRAALEDFRRRQRRFGLVAGE